MSECPWNVHNFAHGACDQHGCPAHVNTSEHRSGCLYSIFGGRTDLSIAELALGLGLRPVDAKEQLAAESARFKDLVWLVQQTEAAAACSVPWSERKINLHIATEVLATFPFQQVVGNALLLHRLVEHCATRGELAALLQRFPQLKRLRDSHGTEQAGNPEPSRSPQGVRPRFVGAKHKRHRRSFR